jgi:eukaryotic-like serine/threonine-protein kinase
MATEDDELSTVDANMARPPSSDPLAMERARARVELAMFGVMKPPKLGRYEILDPLAGGGMGIVYAAYDPELQRRVALKVVYPGGGNDLRARDRLMREARALARLDHPNVVRVHDVLSHDGQVVVVMALLEGQTLATWERADRRDWAEVVATYLQAGEGLAAAHSVDVVHRDFKPGNAIISRDGHVRVLDFGLARLSSETEDTVDASSGRALWASSPSRTETGAFVGTFFYASPEQMSGATVSAASDQFSFCVAMHRAVEGVAPFEGVTVDERVASIRRGEIRVATDGRRVPAWLRQLLRRGLSPTPSERFPSMRAMLHELGKPRGLRRWRWPAAAATLGVALSVAVVGLTNRDHAPVCADAGAAIDRVWGPTERTLLVRTLAALPEPFASEIEQRVLANIDARAAEWSRTRTGACLAHAHGEQSDALLDRKMLCLDRQLAGLSSSLVVLMATDADHAANATEIAVGLPNATRCDDAAKIVDEPAPPSTIPATVEVERIRTELARVSALDLGGRSDDALALAHAALHAAQTSGYEPVVAEAGVAVGRISIERGGRADAVAALQVARGAALASGKQPSLAVEAGARLLYVEGMLAPDLDRLARDLAYLTPMSDAVSDEHFARALLFNNAAEVYRIADKLDDARAYLVRARAAAGDAPDIELTAIDRSLAALTPEFAERDRLLRAVWQRMSAELGPHHPRTLDVQLQLATFQIDPERAVDLMAPVCAAYDAMPGFVDTAIECDEMLGFMAAEAGHRDDAIAAYGRSLAAATRPDNAATRSLATAELALVRGNLDGAASAFRDVIARHGDNEPWWDHQQVLQAQFGLGLIALREHRTADAATELASSAAGYRDIVRHTPLFNYSRRADIAEHLVAGLRIAANSPEHAKQTAH